VLGAILGQVGKHGRLAGLLELASMGTEGQFPKIKPS